MVLAMPRDVRESEQAYKRPRDETAILWSLGRSLALMRRPITAHGVEGRRWRLPLADPGRYGLVSAARIVPGTGKLVAVIAQGAPVVGGRIPLAEPDREGVTFELVGVVERVTGVAVKAALYVRARLLPQGPLVADDLHALGLRSEVDVLDEEEAPLHPLVCDRPP